MDKFEEPTPEKMVKVGGIIKENPEKIKVSCFILFNFLVAFGVVLGRYEHINSHSGSFKPGFSGQSFHNIARFKNLVRKLREALEITGYARSICLAGVGEGLAKPCRA